MRAQLAVALNIAAANKPWIHYFSYSCGFKWAPRPFGASLRITFEMLRCNVKMDLIWPLESKYVVSNYPRRCDVHIRPKVTPVLKRSIDIIRINYDARTQEVIVHMGNWRMEFGEFIYRAKCDALGSAHGFSRKELLGFMFDYVGGDTPTDPIALAIIAAVGTLPGPIAEEIIPHLVMSLRTLTAQ